jgi:sentrin-specific protease 1
MINEEDNNNVNKSINHFKCGYCDHAPYKSYYWYSKHLSSKHQTQLNETQELNLTQDSDLHLVLVNAFNIKIMKSDIISLHFNNETKRFNYLNDNIVDFYLQLLAYCQSNKKITQISSYNFTKHFLNKNMTSNLDDKRLKFMTDLFKVNYLLIPICNNLHWTLIWIDMDLRAVYYLNSLCSVENFDFVKKCFNGVKDLLKRSYAVYSDQTKVTLDLNDWKFSKFKNLPQQNNGYDCGAFICMFARCICFDLEINFKQDDISNCRLLIEEEIKKFEIVDSDIFRKTNNITNSA